MVASTLETRNTDLHGFYDDCDQGSFTRTISKQRGRKPAPSIFLELTRKNRKREAETGFRLVNKCQVTSNSVRGVHGDRA
jgi:hypothetical protein